MPDKCQWFTNLFTENSKCLTEICWFTNLMTLVDPVICLFFKSVFIGEGAIAALKSQRNVIAVEEDPILISNIRKKLTKLVMPDAPHDE